MHRKSVVILFITILASAAVVGCSHTDGENNKHVMIETMSMTEKRWISVMVFHLRVR